MAALQEIDKVDFLHRLRRLTDEGKLLWAQGSDQFWWVAELKRFSYTIVSIDKDDLPPYEFTVWSDEKTVATRWSWDMGEPSLLNEALRALYVAAKESGGPDGDLFKEMTLDVVDLEADGGPPDTTPGS